METLHVTSCWEKRLHSFQTKKCSVGLDVLSSNTCMTEGSARREVQDLHQKMHRENLPHAQLKPSRRSSLADQYEPAHFRSMSNVNRWNTLIHIIPGFQLRLKPTWAYIYISESSIHTTQVLEIINIGWSKENQQENSLKLENFWISPCSSKSGNSIGISRVQQRVAKSRPPSATKM